MVSLERIKFSLNLSCGLSWVLSFIYHERGYSIMVLLRSTLSSRLALKWKRLVNEVSRNRKKFVTSLRQLYCRKAENRSAQEGSSYFTFIALRTHRQLRLLGCPLRRRAEGRSLDLETRLLKLWARCAAAYRGLSHESYRANDCLVGRRERSRMARRFQFHVNARECYWKGWSLCWLGWSKKGSCQWIHLGELNEGN